MRHVGWRMPSHARHRGAAPDRRAASRFVYAYYDGIDKVAHEYGLGEYYDAELVAADRLVADAARGAPAAAPRWS